MLNKCYRRPPVVRVEGDSPDEVMRKNPDLIAITESRAIWQYGWTAWSPRARLTGVFSKSPLYVLSDQNGRVMLTSFEPLGSLPGRFRRIIDGPYSMGPRSTTKKKRKPTISRREK